MLKTTFLVAFCCSLLLDSNSDKTNQAIQTITNEDEFGQKTFVKDSSDYSDTFLEKLASSNLKSVELMDSLMIIDGRDSILFPPEPEIGKRTIFTARQEDLMVALAVKRINQTTLEYKVEMVDFGKGSYEYRGMADLRPLFYLGAETDENTLTGNSYLSTEYVDENATGTTMIRIGREDENSHYLLAKIKKKDNGPLMDLALDNYPTLIEK